MNEDQASVWRQIQRTNFISFNSICDYLELSTEQRNQLLDHPKFLINIPRRLAAKMQKGTLEDPLAKQFLPFKEEKTISPEYSLDPVQDKLFQISDRLIKKYTSRALIITTSACAMHCRYCFRQNYDYPASNDHFFKELNFLKQASHIEEVILSGGDPLSLSDGSLFNLLQQIQSIDHVKRIRIHTRFPIGIPERLNDHFLDMMKTIYKPLWVVLHINHSSELDEDVLKSLEKWRRTGVVLLNQAVLLKGVNDETEILEQLCTTLVNHSIQPYYIHQLDPVQGTMHYEVDPKKGKILVAELRNRLSGYAVPQYVQEIPGQFSKTIL
jgi:EF-P beta-lysylation protein EpmB